MVLTRQLRRALTVAGLALVAACGAGASDPDPDPEAATENLRYTYERATRDGIGKFYMGREVSQVMGHLAAGWLERRGRLAEERTDLVIQNLPLEADSVVADIGAGSGYFTFPVAARVPEGRVIAVDIQPEMLAIVEARREQMGTSNVDTVLGTVESPNLEPDSIDLAFIVDAYHEFSHPYEMGSAIAAALKPGGRLVLIEYRAEDRAVPIKPLHKMTVDQVRKEMAALGLEFEANRDFLPQQHFLVFRRPAR
ncbi:MAG: class I SAM-dependent methyltransferase [Pseudomonadota bacterium]